MERAIEQDHVEPENAFEGLIVVLDVGELDEVIEQAQ